MSYSKESCSNSFTWAGLTKPGEAVLSPSASFPLFGVVTDYAKKEAELVMVAEVQAEVQMKRLGRRDGGAD